MFFRNLTFLRFPWNPDAELYKAFARDRNADMGNPRDAWSLNGTLADCAIKPIGPLEMSTAGFISPYGRDDTGTYLHELGGFGWFTLAHDDKLLPGAVVNTAVEAKVAEIAEREGQRPGGRARKRIKDDVLHDLLPKAFVRQGRTDAFLDMQHGYLAVDTATRKTAEMVASELRRALGSFPALPLNAEIAPRSVLTGWLAGEPLPDGLSLGDACELRDPIEGGARVRCYDQELRSDEIAKHLDAGKQVTRLQLVLDDHLRFVLGDDLVIRQLHFLDGAMEQLEDADVEGARAELDAQFALMSCEVRRLFLLLEPALKITKVEG